MERAVHIDEKSKVSIVFVYVLIVAIIAMALPIGAAFWRLSAQEARADRLEVNHDRLMTKITNVQVNVGRLMERMDVKPMPEEPGP